MSRLLFRAGILLGGLAMAAWSAACGGSVGNGAGGGSGGAGAASGGSGGDDASTLGGSGGAGNVAGWAGADATAGAGGGGGSSGMDSGAGAPTGGSGGAGGAAGSGGASGAGGSAGASTTSGTSCATSGPGLDDCGPAAESCCTSLLVPGGTFYRSYDGVNFPLAGIDCCKDQSHPATISTFRLDKYEVTVGRFRKFVAAWDGGWRPAAGAGRHAYLAGGKGLADSSAAGSHETGWNAAWNAELAVDAANWDSNLACDVTLHTWTPSPGGNERQPIDCETWYEAYAFCIWDGGFLPSEAEWNYAASGGSQQRVYPWSNPSDSTAIDCSYANYGGSQCDSGTNAVGSESPNGDGRWGQADLAGNVSEWNLDWYVSPYAAGACADCAYLAPSPKRAMRGGAYGTGSVGTLASWRFQATPELRATTFGARCARAP